MGRNKQRDKNMVKSDKGNGNKLVERHKQAGSSWTENKSTVPAEKRDSVISTTWKDHDEMQPKLKAKSKWQWQLKATRWWPCRAIRWCRDAFTAILRAGRGSGRADLITTLLFFSISLFVGYVVIELVLSMLKVVAAQGIVSDPSCSVVYVTVPGPIMTVSLIETAPSNPARGTYYFSIVNGTTEWMDNIAPPSPFTTLVASTSVFAPVISSVPTSPLQSSGITPTVPAVPTATGDGSLLPTEPSVITTTFTTTGLSGTTLVTTTVITPIHVNIPSYPPAPSTPMATPSTTASLPSSDSSMPINQPLRPWPAFTSSATAATIATLDATLSASWLIMPGTQASITLVAPSPPDRSSLPTGIDAFPSLPIAPSDSVVGSIPADVLVSITSTSRSDQTTIGASPPDPLLPVTSSVVSTLADTFSSGWTTSMAMITMTTTGGPSPPEGPPSVIASSTLTGGFTVSLPDPSQSFGSLSMYSSPSLGLISSVTFDGALSSSMIRSTVTSSVTSSTSLDGIMSIQTDTTAGWPLSATSPASFFPIRDMATKVILYGDQAISFVFPTPNITTTVSYWTGIYPTVTGPLPLDLQTIAPTTRTVRQTPLSALPSFALFSSRSRTFKTVVTTIYVEDDQSPSSNGKRPAQPQTIETVSISSDSKPTPTAAEMSMMASPGPTSCGESGNFTLNFDDTVVDTKNNSVLSVNGLKNPYHHLFYANGYTDVPDKWEPYPAISQPNVAMFLPLTGRLFASQPFAGTLLPGEIGAGPRASVSAYWFNAYSGFFGCALNGVTPCVLRISGYRYDQVLKEEVLVAEQNVTIPACWGYIGCRLRRVWFNEQFQALSGIQFNAYTAGLGIPQVHMVDDLQMEWYNNTCSAGILRIGHR